MGPTVKASGINTMAAFLYVEPLISHDHWGRPQPSLASSWTWERNGHLLRLQLKEGVRLHDGSPLTATLVRRFLEPLVSAPLSDRPLGFQRVTGIEAIGEHAIAITLSRPDHFLLTALGEYRLVHPDDADVGTGPFRLTRREPTVQTRRFEEYHGGLPGSPGIEIIPYDSQRSAWAALMRGEVDAAQEITRDAVDFMERSSAVVTHASTQPFYIPLVFNHRHPAFSDTRVRRAIELALDKARIVDRGMQGRGVVAHGPIWRDHWAYEPPAGVGAFEPEQAIELLESAGYTVPPANPHQPRLKFRCLFWSEDAQYERIALMVQRQLADIGVEVELVPMSLRELADRSGRGDFDALLARANAGRSLMFTYLFWHSGGGSGEPLWRTAYSGVDHALDQLRDSTTDDQVRTAIRALATRFHEDVPAVFIAWTEVNRAISSGIVVDADVPDPFTSIWKWQRVVSGSRP